MSTAPSPILALVEHLKADTTVAEEVGERVFGSELPEDECDSMPEASIVVKRAGGLDVIGQGFQEYGDIRVDVLCYAATPFLAEDLHLAVHPAMKQLRRTVYGDCVLHWARSSGGAIPLRDPDTDWPFTFSSWQVLVGELSAV
ncbi:MAG: hypothetical protein KGZ65_00105 [Sphingomonadales bacterium]|nr:hypothetical protein [Sphingomonadaceae bacterium]MBS3929608.1 hypothetical protein [Sphingomonadales bacterium]